MQSCKRYSISTPVFLYGLQFFDLALTKPTAAALRGSTTQEDMTWPTAQSNGSTQQKASALSLLKLAARTFSFTSPLLSVPA